MNVGDRLKAKGAKPEPKRGPLWEGPQSDGPNGGITFSMLSRFLTCRARFKAAYIDGWKANDNFNKSIEYGNLWHTCEEALASGVQDWGHNLANHRQLLSKKYQLDSEQIEHWYNVCRVQFPLYVEHWKHHPDVKNRTPLLQEQVFDVPYTLPSGRVVRLRGKWDSVSILGQLRKPLGRRT